MLHFFRLFICIFIIILLIICCCFCFGYLKYQLCQYLSFGDYFGDLYNFEIMVEGVTKLCLLDKVLIFPEILFNLCNVL